MLARMVGVVAGDLRDDRRFARPPRLGHDLPGQTVVVRMSGSRQRPQSGPPPIKRGFISYAHDDRQAFALLRRDLAVLGEEFGIEFWHDAHIHTGDRWDPAIQAAVGAADIFVLAVSTPWLASGYIRDEEWPAIQARLQAADGLVCPVILSHCRWEYRLGHLQPTPLRGHRPLPIANWRKRNDGYHAATGEIASAITAYLLRKNEPVPANAAGIEPKQSLAVPVWMVEGAKLILDPAGDNTDLAAADEPAVKQLHGAVRKLARELARMGRGADNWMAGDQTRKFQKTVADFARETAPTAKDAAGLVGTLWPAFLALADLQAGFAAMTHTADPELRDDVDRAGRTLDRLTMLAGSLVRSFPTIRAWDTGAARAALQPNPALLAAAERLFAASLAQAVIDPADLPFLVTVDRQEAARNLVVKIVGIAAWDLLGRAAASDTDRTLLRGVTGLLDKAEADIAPFLDAFSPDYQATVVRLTEEARKPERESAFGKPRRRSGPLLEIKEGKDLPVMWLIRAGSFVMGAPEAEDKREGWHDDSARPQHSVTIPQPFYLGKYPVTRGQYAAFVKATGYDKDGGEWRHPGFRQTNAHPVVNVSHDDAMAYAAWVSERTGQTYRLPGEAEWEYAARAGKPEARYWGDSWDDAARYAWVPEKQHGTAVVGGDRLPNDYGLYDMLGNVWEWCADHWHNSYKGAPDDGSDWITDGDSGRCVLRGGSWYGNPGVVRVGVRYGIDRGFRSNDAGFRLSRTLSGPTS